MRVVVAGGGTAGHVSPAIALARALAGDEVAFVGTRDGVEATMVPAAGFELDEISIGGFDRARPLSLPAVGLRAVGAVRASRRILSLRRPDVVVGMGGYVSLPVALAAATKRIPIVLHEQNIVFGLAHRVTKPLARRVAVSFEETLVDAGRKGVLTGNPVQPELVAADLVGERKRALAGFDLDDTRSTVLVFGGSLGARTITDAALDLGRMWADRSDVQILHILGRRGGDIVVPQTAGLIYRAVPYVERMVEAYAVADIAVCRGGASTIAELTVVGVPSVVVPYPHHRDRQQERHARVLERAGAAVVVPDAQASAERLAAVLDPLLADAATRDEMRRASSSLGRPDAAAALAGIVRTVAS